MQRSQSSIITFSLILVAATFVPVRFSKKLSSDRPDRPEISNLNLIAKMIETSIPLNDIGLETREFHKLSDDLSVKHPNFSAAKVVIVPGLSKMEADNAIIEVKRFLSSVEESDKKYSALLNFVNTTRTAEIPDPLKAEIAHGKSLDSNKMFAANFDDFPIKDLPTEIEIAKEETLQAHKPTTETAQSEFGTHTLSKWWYVVPTMLVALLFGAVSLHFWQSLRSKPIERSIKIWTYFVIISLVFSILNFNFQFLPFPSFELLFLRHFGSGIGLYGVLLRS